PRSSLPSIHPPHPSPTLFPYTTLFRSGDRVAPTRLPASTSVRGRVLAAHRLGGGPAGQRRGLMYSSRSAPLRPSCPASSAQALRSEEHTSELQSRFELVCRLLL